MFVMVDQIFAKKEPLFAEATALVAVDVATPATTPVVPVTLAVCGLFVDAGAVALGVEVVVREDAGAPKSEVIPFELVIAEVDFQPDSNFSTSPIAVPSEFCATTR